MTGALPVIYKKQRGKENSMKKIFALLMACAMFAGLTACGSSNSSSSASGSNGAAASASGEPVVIQIAYENNPGEPIDLGCNEWARLIQERSNGSMANAVDSLAAIKDVVFDKQILSLAEFAEILQKNFVGYEELQKYVSRKCPKYGNDDDTADLIMIRSLCIKLS